MAFTPAKGDTDPVFRSQIASRIIRPPRGVNPLTGRTATSGRLPTGRSNLTFSSTNVPQPARTAGNPDIAPARNTNIRGGQGPKENQLRNAITGLGKKFGRQIGSFIGRELDFAATRQGFEEMENVASSSGGAFSPELNFGSSQPPTQSFTPAPVTATVIPVTGVGIMKDGGFIRKRT